MNLTWILWIALFLAGASMVPLGVPGGVFSGIVVLAFVVIIATYYRAAIRQGHSGLVILPIKKGPVGYDGLRLQTNTIESKVLLGCTLLILGTIAGLVLAMYLE